MVVYFIQRESDKAVKIGFSHRMKNRLDNLKSETHESLKVLCIIDGGRPIERTLHDQFAYCRREGEWFGPHLDLSNYIANLSDESLDIEVLPDDTSIRVSKTTKSRLAKFGHVDDSYDDVIVRLMDKSEKCDREHQK